MIIDLLISRRRGAPHAVRIAGKDHTFSTSPSLLAAVRMARA